MQNILIPTDFSDCAHFATEAAIQLACKTGATLHFMHLMDVPVDWLYPHVDMDQRYPDVSHRVKDVKNRMNSLVAEVEKKGCKAKVVLEYNQSFKAVLHYAARIPVDMIVMGSHGAHGIKEMFIGSNTQRIIRLSTIPVWVVKQPLKDTGIQHIVFSSDFEKYAAHSFLQIVNFANLWEAKIHLLFVNTPYNFTENDVTEQKLKSWASLASQTIGSENIYNIFNLERGLNRFCHEKQADLIAITKHARGEGSSLFADNAAESLINHLRISVLCVHSKEP